MQEPPCFLSLDLGTTTCRCVAFDVQGHALAKASRETTLFCPAMNHAEADPHEWWSAVREAIRRVLESDSSLASRIAAVGLTGLQHAMVPIDEHGQPLSRVMLWMDQRCQPQINRLNTREKETIEKVAGRGARVVATHSLPKLCWLTENEPELVKKARYFLLPKDYIRYCLTGSIATDPSDAGGTMLYDQRSGDWSPSLVQLSGISLQQLPPIRPSHEVNGFITPEAAALTGLPEGLPVVVGAGDVRATILGMGGESSDQALVYLGTAAWVRFKDSGIGTRLRATATTGAALRWLRDLLGGSYEELVAEAATVPPGAEGLVFLPHLCGERAPFYSSEVRGSLLGLNLRHGRGHLVQAVLEGCACHLRWLVEGREDLLPDHAIIAGGGAHSLHWVQVMADVLGMTMWIPEVVEAGALGAAILAAVGSGAYADEQEAMKHMVRLVKQVMPRQELRPVYNEVYQRFRQAEEMTTMQQLGRVVSP